MKTDESVEQTILSQSVEVKAQSTVRLSDKHIGSFKSKRTQLGNKSDRSRDGTT